MDHNPNTVVAIHQPNFFPWLGYFDKIARSDIFIFMDNAQFPKTGSGTWINRVKMLINGKPDWVTLPINRQFSGVRRICEIEINNEIEWRKKIIKKIQASYSKAPFYGLIFPVFERLIYYQTMNLSEFNIFAITELCLMLGIDTKKLRIGNCLDVQGLSTELLITMTKAVKGNVYMCGGGATGYQQDTKFQETCIGLIYQNFDHPTYNQRGIEKFIPGLSIMDCLFNIGIEGVRSLLNIDRRNKI